MATQDQLGPIYTLIREQSSETAALKTQIAVLQDHDKRTTQDVAELELTVATLRLELTVVNNRLGRLGWLGSIILAAAAAVGALLKGAASMWSVFSPGSH